ncbi:ABC transporter permease [Pelolinea submarina]|uniref:Nucleoside ABC transporter membrane protein n=1 Tax=Pelolinea submarina TaxID=913107 RepID=A0A347ZV31_9CHLR|nr:ABC transporter permease [Pelolinea submarina]REG10252.1 nucleoside ABC transporter membrane protein [Pelolinea submarina]BBB49162.1 simple sugar transport system permease protein [Pelolinea submarina]
MEKENKPQKKPNSFEIFLEEIQHSSWIVTFLAIMTGIILGGLLAAITSLEMYAAFKVSFWDGIKTGLQVAWSTYSALFTGSVGDFGKIKIALAGGDALEIRRAFFPFFESLVQSTPYIFGGLAVAVGFRAGLFNIGVEGQIFIGALTGTWAGYAITGLPAIIHVPLALLCGFLGGALWGFIPGLLKAKTGASEVINTIMMNYIAFRFSEYMLRGPMKDPTEYTPKTPVIADTAKLYHFFQDPIRFHLGFFIALAVAAFIYWLLFKTTWGFELRTVGANSNAARYAGMSNIMVTILAMALSGGLAGLAGANEVLGVNFRLVPAFSSGYGFDSIALALLGKNHPVGVVLSALLFGFLRSGARQMQLKAGIPIDIISILQALILAFIAAPAIIRTIYRLKESKIKEEEFTLSGWGG